MKTTVVMAAVRINAVQVFLSVVILAVFLAGVLAGKAPPELLVGATVIVVAGFILRLPGAQIAVEEASRSYESSLNRVCQLFGLYCEGKNQNYTPNAEFKTALARAADLAKLIGRQGIADLPVGYTLQRYGVIVRTMIDDSELLLRLEHQKTGRVLGWAAES